VFLLRAGPGMEFHAMQFQQPMGLSHSTPNDV
jgi:hypothetical protein